MDTESFRGFLQAQNLADKTVCLHVKLVSDYLDRFGEITSDISKTIKNIMKESTLSKSSSLIGSISKYYQFAGFDNKGLVDYMQVINTKYDKELAEKRKDMASDETLPTIAELKEKMNIMYKMADYRGYVVLFLLLQYQVRNQDMVAEVVSSKKQTNKEDNWFVVRDGSVLWIRNKYKTAFSYGSKEHIIKNKKFRQAISNLDHVLKPDENIFRMITRATGGVTETQMMKIFMREANTMNSVRKVAKNRGTSTALLVSN